jgi:predicted enzyme related to lactoylglutathione lyase
MKRRLSPRWVELAGAQIPVFLLGGLPSIADLGSVKAERSYRRHWTPVHLDFIVADLDEAVARLKALGAVLDRPMKNREYGRIANLADPFGNGFDVIQFTGSGYDAVDRREE